MTALFLSLLAQGDPRLAAKVDLRLKIVPIDEAVTALGKAAGVELTTSTAIRDLKITILVDGTAALRVMNRIADTMRMQWKPESGGYRLVNDPDAASREAAFLKLQAEGRRKGFSEWMRTQAAAAEVPFRDVPGAYLEAQKVAYNMKPNDPKRDAAFRRMNALASMQSRDSWLQARLIRSLGPSGQGRLLAGETLGASTSPGRGGLALPIAALNYPQWISPNGDGEENMSMRPSRIDLFMRMDPETGTIEFRSDQAGEDGRSRGMSRGSNGASYGEDPSLYENPFWKEVMGWGQEELKDPTMVLRCDPKTPERPSVWWTGYATMADRLEWLHESSGLPIVAMSFRQPTRRSTLRFEGTVGDWIKDARKAYDNSAFRVADGFLMVRPYEFWVRRRQEPPEALVRRLEARESPTLEDYAEFAARVTDRQAALAASTSEFAMRVSPYALNDGTPALRLWGALAPAQRAILRQGGAVAYRALSGPARAAYAAAVGDVFGGAWHDGAMAARFSGATPVSFDDWGILGDTRNVQAVGRSRPEPLDRDYSKPYEYKQEPNTAAISLMLGLSREDSVRYTLPLAGLPRAR